MIRHKALTVPATWRSLATKIATVNKYIDQGRAQEVIDATDCMVVLGLIDFHIHYFEHSSELAVCADSICLPNGVTSAVDAGSADIANYDAFNMGIIQRSHTRLKAFINICATGLPSLNFHEEINPKYYNPVKLCHMFEKYPDTILGLKIGNLLVILN